MTSCRKIINYINPHIGYRIGWGALKNPLALKSDGLSQFAGPFSRAEVRRLTLFTVDTKKFDYKKLRGVCPPGSQVPLVEAFENIGILSHVIKTLKVLEFISKAKEDPERTVSYLRTRGNKDEIGADGIAGSASYFTKLSEMSDGFKTRPKFQRVLLASLWLHDIGKLITEEYHFALSEKILRTDEALKKTLLSMFGEKELEWITFLAANHSLIPDTAILKERNILHLFETIVSAPAEKDMKKELLKALLVIGICDGESYNKLSDQKIKDMFDIYKKASELIDEERPADKLMDSEMNNAEWGKIRFGSWTVREGSKKPNEEEIEALNELAKIYPNENDKNEFFETLGRIELVGLIYDLRREIGDPAARTRLLVWLATLMKKYEKEGLAWCEFCITRSKKDILKREAEKLSDLLMARPIEDIEGLLDITLDRVRKGILIRIPA